MSAFTAPAFVSTRADHAEQAHVVLDARDPGRRRVFDRGLEGFDLAIALRALAEHDVGVLLTVDVTRTQVRGREDGDLEAVLLGKFAHLQQVFLRHGQLARICPGDSGHDGLHPKPPDADEFGFVVRATVRAELQEQRLPDSRRPLCLRLD
jgi:hypothetical protein